MNVHRHEKPNSRPKTSEKHQGIAKSKPSPAETPVAIQKKMEALKRQLAHQRQTIRALEAEIARRRSVETGLVQSRRELKRISRHSMDLLEKDRREVAKKIHDDLGAGLSFIKYMAEEQQTQIEKHPMAPGVSLKPIIEHLSDIIKSVKAISAGLRPTILDDLGLGASLVALVRRLRAEYKGMRIACHIDINEAQLPEAHKIVIYRIVEEAMGRAARHAQPDYIYATIHQENDTIRLTVSDNGQASERYPIIVKNEKFSRDDGLQILSERIRILGGALRIELREDGGRVITVKLPLSPKTAP